MTTRGLPIAERLALGFSKGAENECWPWRKSISRAGYGQIRVNGKSLQAHRVAYELAFGHCPRSLVVMHKCDNRRCVNPRHLLLGTVDDNNRDRHEKGRSAGAAHIGELNPLSKLTEEAVLAIRASPLSLSKAAEAFGVSFQTISNIRRRLTWRHVP